MSASTCSASGTGLTTATAGHVSSFKIQAKDAYSNSLTSGGLTFTISLTGPGSVTPVYTDLATGQYSVSYTPTLSGSYTLAVALSGVAISGSPFTVTVSPTIAAASTTAVVGVLAAGIAGAAYSFTVGAKDAYGNTITTGGDNFYVVVSDNRGGLLRGNVADQSDGTYVVSFTSPAAGSYLMFVALAANAYGTPNGLTGRYYNNRYLNGAPVVTRVDKIIQFDWGADLITPTAVDYVSIQWTV